jgi:hypothetical protein
MATDWGGCLSNVLLVRPAKLGKKPRSSAVVRVDNAGENNVACANATSSAGVADCTAE